MLRHLLSLRLQWLARRVCVALALAVSPYAHTAEEAPAGSTPAPTNNPSVEDTDAESRSGLGFFPGLDFTGKPNLAGR